MNSILVVLGVLFLVAAAGAFVYAVDGKGGFMDFQNVLLHPYQVYAFPLLIGGVVLAAVGLVKKD